MGTPSLPRARSLRGRPRGSLSGHCPKNSYSPDFSDVILMKAACGRQLADSIQRIEPAEPSYPSRCRCRISMSVQILLADDQQVVREAIRACWNSRASRWLEKLLTAMKLFASL